MKSTFDDIMGMMTGDFGEEPVVEKKKSAVQAAQDDVMDMLVGDFNPNHDPDNGQFTEGGGSSGGGSSYNDKLVKSYSGSMKPGSSKHVRFEEVEGTLNDFIKAAESEGFTVSQNTGESVVITKPKEAGKATNKDYSSSRKGKAALKRAIEKDLGLEDLEFKSSDRYDFFESDRGDISVAKLKDALKDAYNEGVKKAAKGTKSISAAQITKAVNSKAEKWFGFDIKEMGADGYDFFESDRGDVSVWRLQSALEHMYGAGFSSGDHYE